jgi:hypothetical protein
MNIGQDTAELLVSYIPTAYIQILMKKGTMEKICSNVLKFLPVMDCHEKFLKTDYLKPFVLNLKEQKFVKLYLWIKTEVFESTDEK